MNESQPPPPPPAGHTRLKKFQSPLFLWPATVALAVLLYFGLGLLVDVFTQESTDDAFIAGHVVSIAPRIAGQVTAVHVLDNEFVHSNEPLVELDPADYAMTVAQKKAAAAAQEASFKTMLAGWQLMQAKVVTAQADARKAQADADADESTAKKTQADFDRAADLRKANTISQQEFDAARAANDKAQADLQSGRENVLECKSKVDEANRTLDAAWAQVGAVEAQFHEAQTNVAAAGLNLSYTTIYAPCDGRVTRKAVEVGDYLEVGQQIMSLVPAEVWVVANFKESQLKNMMPGQRATVAIDALGGRKFRAHVDSVQAGSGAAFSLLPPENATGNFVKVVQRVPVKIVFDEPLPADHVFGPGLSVVPSVQVASFSLPDWATALVAGILAVAAALVFQAVARWKLAGK
jgi:membrane fusion protein (multidrug efflux system)